MSEPSPSEVTFVYEESNDKRTITATGAHGGTSPDGAAVVANLFVEKGSVPHHIKHELDSEGRVDTSESGDLVTRGEVTREIQTSLVMTPEHAEELGEWLLQAAQKAKERRSKNFG